MQRVVTKRDGKQEKFQTKKIVNAIFAIMDGLDFKDDYEIVYKILKELDLKVPESVSTEELDYLVLKAIEQLIPNHYIYDTLATRQLLKIISRKIDKRFNTFSDYVNYGIKENLLQKQLNTFDLKTLESEIDFDRDNNLNYFGLSMMRDRYFMKDRTDDIIEKPQWMFMRVAMGVGNNEEEMLKVYNKISKLEYLHSTPTLYNSGTITHQYSSCYINVIDDSLDDIMGKANETSQLAKYAGGVGSDVTRIRATGSKIKSLNAKSSGIIPFIKIFDTVVNAIQQGGRRRSSQVIYLQPWHLDIEAFLELKETTGNSYFRSPSLNTALWMPDEIMRRIKDKEPIYLFDPAECTELVDACEEEFTKIYNAKIKDAESGKLKLWSKIDSETFFSKYLSKLAKTGHPWLTFKDAHNRHNPCKEYSVINSSNLCTEISIPNSPESTAVCTLASINIVKHVNKDKSDVDWDKLRETIEVMVLGLDNILDKNFYPSPESKKNTQDLRPLGIGLMGLAETFVELGLSYDSKEAVALSGKMGKFMREVAYKKSEALAKEKGAFPHYEAMKKQGKKYDYTPRRNSVLLAIAPTASISIIAGTTSTVDSYFSNVYSRDTLSGKFIVINKQLIQKLEELEMWNDEMADKLKQFGGSVQPIEELEGKINKELFKTTYEIHPNSQIDIAAAFQESIDQSISKSIYLEESLRSKMRDVYIYAWEKGLKSTYYCFVDKTIKGEKYTSNVNKRGLRKGFGKTAGTSAVAANGGANGNGASNGNGTKVKVPEPVAETEENPEALIAEAREKFGDEIVDKVIGGDVDACPTDPLLSKICPSCE